MAVLSRRLMFVVNNPAFFLSHRATLAEAALAAGYEVHVATMDDPSVPRIQAMGITHHVIPMSRSGKNPVQELKTLWALYRLFKAARPDLVHLVTIKPVLYGGIAARLARVPAMVAAISGLGYVFVAEGARARLVRSVVRGFYRLALGHPDSRVIFQNTNDRDVLRNLGVVRPAQMELIRGSGVDLAQYRFQPEPPEPPVVVLMVARLLRDKGVREFVEAAALLRQQGLNVRMRLAGDIDPGNPASISAEEVQAWSRGGLVELLGERKDVAELYAAAHIAVLPSYREGLSKSLIEAAACGRAVVTTDVPGCRDAIDPDETGLLVPARDATALAAALARLVMDAAQRQQLGRAGRALAEREFSIEDVCNRHLAIYASLLVAARR
ncbi:glycosyltransferase family 4 protein [Bordetella holmesii]|nr:glycosyltransferase family 4 protein [Bordetella holmesii]AHV94650.1 glycosyl transferases group 1 family protein [Bordetella holmesii ATCC 51541]AIT25157.1 glycosyl transferases group 1 family protein [Bordetella holmesii 44057]EWM48870.1 glycosyl transferases group 1 family protein [Bordetella holmesii 41130]EWM49847.1 glycosyl transferases group 1 family protein [Bordetella holmesii 35009]AMD44392.1 glycosyl transferase family 1 [Bordetella holmesii H558]